MSGRRMDGKDADELALDDKLDVARTLLTLGNRIDLRHKKNLVETAIKQSHKEEVNDGEISQAVVPTTDEILGLFAKRAPSLTTGTDATKSDK